MTLPHADFDYYRNLVRKECGMVLEDGKEYLVESRLRALARQEDIPTIEALLCRMRSGSGDHLLDRVVQAVLIGETQFFRDGHPFEALRKVILPELIERRSAQRTLNLWCAASASGQEPYSMAMVIAEDFPELATWNLSLIASDLSDGMLERTKKGVYSEVEVSRGLPPELRSRYFQTVDGSWRLSERIRRQVQIRNINLVRDWPTLPRMDLVLLRNVLIYFAEPTRRVIITKLGELLRPGGYLLLGTSESLASEDGEFAQVRIGRTICYRRS